MSGLQYVGPDLTLDDDVVYKAYVDSIKSGDVTNDHVDQVIAQNLSSYATKSYADTRDALLATKAYVDGQDDLRIKLAQKNIANGVPALGASGTLLSSLINAPSAESYVRGPWSPSAYPSSPATANSSSEVTLYTCPITDPGYTYKPVVFGSQEVQVDADGIVYPTVLVRLGSATGPIIAQGAGYPEVFGRGIDLFNRTSATTLGSDWNSIQITGNPVMGTNGNSAYVATGDNQTFALNMRANTEDAQAASDYIRVSFTVEGTVNNSSVTEIDIIGRAKMTGNTINEYVAFRFGNNSVNPVYVPSGGSQVSIGSGASVPLVAGSTYDCDFGVYSAGLPRRYRVYVDGSQVFQGDETGSVMDSSHRQWGFTMATWFGTRPGNISAIRMREQDTTIADATSEAVVSPVGLQNITAVTGATTLYVQMLRQGSVGKVIAGNYKPGLFVQAVPV